MYDYKHTSNIGETIVDNNVNDATHVDLHKLQQNDDKNAVAVLKNGNWQERGPVTDQCHDRSGKPVKRSDRKLGRNSSKRQLSDARQLGCVFQDMTPPKSILRKGTDMPKPIQRVKFKKAIARHTKIPKSFARIYLPR